MSSTARTERTAFRPHGMSPCTAPNHAGGASARTRTQPALPLRLRPQNQTLLRRTTRPLRGTDSPALTSRRSPTTPSMTSLGLSRQGARDPLGRPIRPAHDRPLPARQAPRAHHPRTAATPRRDRRRRSRPRLGRTTRRDRADRHPPTTRPTRRRDPPPPRPAPPRPAPKPPTRSTTSTPDPSTSSPPASPTPSPSQSAPAAPPAASKSPPNPDRLSGGSS